jgi:hypothetical protein
MSLTLGLERTGGPGFLRCVGPRTSPCGTTTVTAASLYPTRDSCFYRMYFQANLSFSVHGQTVLEKEEDESLYR